MLTLVIGDKNLSSWSMRPWLVMRHFGVPFQEIGLLLDTPQFEQQILAYSGARRVPVLLDGPQRIWDSLAIVEYVNERLDGRAWPADAAVRAHARSVSCEMHSGFATLRTTWPMRVVGRNPRVPLAPAGLADVARIDEIWQDCRARYAERGPWLFGAFSIADAMYAPIVMRFTHYEIARAAPPLSDAAKAYCEHWLQDAHMQAWCADAEREVAAGGSAQT
jgi:glutathione S-transferase